MSVGPERVMMWVVVTLMLLLFVFLAGYALVQVF